jgi:hypothetical protein
MKCHFAEYYVGLCTREDEVTENRMRRRPKRSNWMLLLHGDYRETKGRHVWGKKVGNEQREENAKRNFKSTTATKFVTNITKKEHTTQQQPPGRKERVKR